ncbi:hypothetical protein ACVJGD_008626 [Bradyrhizobium sp. USDA 10063]
MQKRRVIQALRVACPVLTRASTMGRGQLSGSDNCLHCPAAKSVRRISYASVIMCTGCSRCLGNRLVKLGNQTDALEIP